LNSLYAFNSLICTIVCMLFFTAFYVVLLCAYSINNNNKSLLIYRAFRTVTKANCRSERVCETVTWARCHTMTLWRSSWSTFER